jgi:hypothetical protein
MPGTKNIERSTRVVCLEFRIVWGQSPSRFEEFNIVTECLVCAVRYSTVLLRR